MGKSVDHDPNNWDTKEHDQRNPACWCKPNTYLCAQGHRHFRHRDRYDRVIDAVLEANGVETGEIFVDMWPRTEATDNGVIALVQCVN